MQASIKCIILHFFYAFSRDAPLLSTWTIDMIWNGVNGDHKCFVFNKVIIMISHFQYSRRSNVHGSNLYISSHIYSFYQYFVFHWIRSKYTVNFYFLLQGIIDEIYGYIRKCSIKLVKYVFNLIGTCTHQVWEKVHLTYTNFICILIVTG